MEALKKTQNSPFGDWKRLLKEEVEAEVLAKIDEVLLRNKSIFDLASQENKRIILERLIKIFRFKPKDNFSISADRVYLMLIPKNNFVQVALHYLVYLRFAKEHQIEFLGFEPFSDGDRKGEKIILEKDGKTRTYFLFYDAFKDRTGVWKTHFDVMFRKTLAKQSLMFFFPEVFETDVLSEVSTFDSDDIIEESETQVQNTTERRSQSNNYAEREAFKKQNTAAFAKINENISVFASDAILRDKFYQFLKQKGYKSVLNIDNEEDLKYALAYSAALRANKETGTDAEFVMNKRSELLQRMKEMKQNSEINTTIIDFLKKHNYSYLSEIGKPEHLDELERIIETKTNKSSDLFETK